MNKKINYESKKMYISNLKSLTRPRTAREQAGPSPNEKL